MTIREVNILSEQFRNKMDELSKDNKIKKVHLFYPCPNSLAFKLGTVFSESIHPNVIVYNYTRADTPCYSWSYNVLQDEIENYFK